MIPLLKLMLVDFVMHPQLLPFVNTGLLIYISSLYESICCPSCISCNCQREYPRWDRTTSRI